MDSTFEALLKSTQKMAKDIKKHHVPPPPPTVPKQSVIQNQQRFSPPSSICSLTDGV